MPAPSSAPGVRPLSPGKPALTPKPPAEPPVRPAAPAEPPAEPAKETPTKDRPSKPTLLPRPPLVERPELVARSPAESLSSRGGSLDASDDLDYDSLSDEDTDSAEDSGDDRTGERTVLRPAGKCVLVARSAASGAQRYESEVDGGRDGWKFSHPNISRSVFETVDRLNGPGGLHESLIPMHRLAPHLERIRSEEVLAILEELEAKPPGLVTGPMNWIITRVRKRLRSGGGEPPRREQRRRRRQESDHSCAESEGLDEVYTSPGRPRSSLAGEISDRVIRLNAQGGRFEGLMPLERVGPQLARLSHADARAVLGELEAKEPGHVTGPTNWLSTRVRKLLKARRTQAEDEARRPRDACHRDSSDDDRGDRGAGQKRWLVRCPDDAANEEAWKVFLSSKGKGDKGKGKGRRRGDMLPGEGQGRRRGRERGPAGDSAEERLERRIESLNDFLEEPIRFERVAQPLSSVGIEKQNEIFGRLRRGGIDDPESFLLRLCKKARKASRRSVAVSSAPHEEEPVSRPRKRHRGSRRRR